VVVVEVTFKLFPKKVINGAPFVVIFDLGEWICSAFTIGNEAD
jgi:hypothetical protein